MNYCSEVSHFSYKNTVLLIQLKSSMASPAGEMRSPQETGTLGHPSGSPGMHAHPLEQGFQAPALPPTSAPELLCLQQTPRTNSSNSPLFMEGWILGRGRQTQALPSPCGHACLPAPFTRTSIAPGHSGLQSSLSRQAWLSWVRSRPRCEEEAFPVSRWAAFGKEATTLQAGGPAWGRRAQSGPGGTSAGRGGQSSDGGAAKRCSTTYHRNKPRPQDTQPREAGALVYANGVKLL